MSSSNEADENVHAYSNEGLDRSQASGGEPSPNDDDRSTPKDEITDYPPPPPPYTPYGTDPSGSHPSSRESEPTAPPPYRSGCEFTPPPGDPPEMSSPIAQQTFVHVQGPPTVLYSDQPHLDFGKAIAFSCAVVWLCGVVFGGLAFIFAAVGQCRMSRRDRKSALCLRKTSYALSIVGIVLGTVSTIMMIIFYNGAFSSKSSYSTYHYYG